MQRFWRFVTSLSFAFCTTIFATIIISNKFFPEVIPVVSSSVSYKTGIYTVKDNGDDETLTVKVLNIPVKTAQMVPVKREYAVVSGDVFGIRLYSDGIVIVGTGTVATRDGGKTPGASAGLCVGDVIKAINGRRVTRNSDLGAAVNSSGGKSIELLICNNKGSKVVNFTPVLSAEDNKYKAGLWIRDSTAGIGTITYFDPDTLIFAGLGHGICDIDTGELMPLLGGDAVYADIADVYKGTKQCTGELCGIFLPNVMGSLLKNTSSGIFGSVTANEIRGVKMPIAMNYEVKIGKAQIISRVDSSLPKNYDIEITKLYFNDDGTKNMAIKVTDEELLSKTGGIIQGMSGSPIIQNGMLVGAVTHVIVSDPTKGYGIFAQNMIAAFKEN